MVYHPSSSTGQHALDEIQSHSADLGYGWQSGLDASLTTSTSSIESEWTAGSILWDGEVIDIPSGTITHDAGDADNPRWDALAVTASDGTIQAIKGTPAPVATDDEGNTYPGEQAWTPSPSDQITRDMVVFGLVWIPAGAANNDDLTNTSAGGVSEPVVDRRVEVPGQEEQVTRGTDITSSGWYRIASVGPVQDSPETQEEIRASALFSVRDSSSQLHSSTSFRGSLYFSNNPTLSLQNSSYYTGTHGAITGLRVVHPDGTYEGGAIEVNVQLQGQTSVPVEYSITHNHAQPGWTPEPWTAGEVPTGFNTTELDLSLDPIQAVAADGTNDMFVVQRNGTVLTDHQEQRNVAAVARLSTDLTVSPGTVTDVPFDTFEDDWGAWDASSFDFVVPQYGWYSVDFTGRWNDMTDGVRVGVVINASGYSRHQCWNHSGTGNVFSSQGHATFDLAEGDVISVSVRQNSGSDKTLQGTAAESYCAIRYIG